MNYKLKKRDLVWNMYCPSTVYGILTPHGKIVLLKWLLYRKRVGYLVPLENALHDFLVKQDDDIRLKLREYLNINGNFRALIPEAWNMPYCLKGGYKEEECLKMIKRIRKTYITNTIKVYWERYRNFIRKRRIPFNLLQLSANDLIKISTQPNELVPILHPGGRAKVLAFLRYTAEKRFYYLPLMIYEFIKIQRDKSLRAHLITYLEFRDDINVSVYECSLKFVPELGITVDPRETQFWVANDIFTPDLRVILLEQLKLSKC